MTKIPRKIPYFIANNLVLYLQKFRVRCLTKQSRAANNENQIDCEGGLMKKKSMAVLTIVTVALMMSWVIPAIAADLQTVNINTATVDELMELDGIGQKVAERIFAFREKNGPFQKPEDLMMVKGIGEKIFEVNKSKIVIQD